MARLTVQQVLDFANSSRFIFEKETRVIDGVKYNYVVDDGHGVNIPCRTLMEALVEMQFWELKH